MNNPTREELRDQVQRLVCQIPQGAVTNYGAIGAACQPPISGYICGRLMKKSPGDLPWWRVVAKDGSLPASKRSPQLGDRQRHLLEEEGIEFGEDGKVAQKYFFNLVG